MVELNERKVKSVEISKQQELEQILLYFSTF